ncbi:MAG TPA: GNAT family N-acetyltransferase [Flavobacteriaceae bacterium]|nr:GNAT family N-acetyltransferase [Flavobacteriaceae bacterium]
MEITHHQDTNKGYFRAVSDGQKTGKMTYSKAGTTKIIIDHTEVEDAFSGQGVGKKLLYEAVAYARKENLKIIPLCPFAKAMFQKIDDIKDVLS